MITGAHRSMTSLLARQLSLAGLGFGDSLLPGNEFNPDGYFEDRPLVEFHRLLLHRHKQSWLTAMPDAASASSPRDLDFVKRYAAHRSATAPVWAVKDPQLGLFVPVWRSALRQTRLLAIFRHPAEVCRSVVQRSCIVSGNVLEARLARLLASDPDCAARMWVSYNQAILAAWNSAPASTAIIDTRWLARPDLLAQMLEQRWQLPLPHGPAEMLFDARRLSTAPPVLEVGDEELAEDIHTTWQSLRQAKLDWPGLPPVGNDDSLDVRVSASNHRPAPVPSNMALAREKSAEGFDMICMRVRHFIRRLSFPNPGLASREQGVGGAE